LLIIVGFDDYIWVSLNGRLGVQTFRPGPDFSKYDEYDTNIYCRRRGVRFADIDGDGKADFICLSPNGDMSAWLNRPGPSLSQPKWQPLGIIKHNEGWPQGQVRLGDIDGDGRDDYMIVMLNGDIYAW
jgi:FG-GAP-like repeat